MTMLTHYFKIALRNMQKQKMYAAINIGGFAIGIAACLLLSLYIQHELSYDQDNHNKDHIYRIFGEAKRNREVENAGRTMSSELFGGANNQVRRTDQVNDTYESGFCFADTSVLDILNVHMVYGNRKDALSEPS